MISYTAQLFSHNSFSLRTLDSLPEKYPLFDSLPSATTTTSSSSRSPVGLSVLPTEVLFHLYERLNCTTYDTFNHKSLSVQSYENRRSTFSRLSFDWILLFDPK